ncbi:MAG: hypothetical protein JJK57_16320 [Komagataeibacter hansenii]|nr:hypothetical protein [Novacetimonas hansenii]
MNNMEQKLSIDRLTNRLIFLSKKKEHDDCLIYFIHYMHSCNPALYAKYKRLINFSIYCSFKSKNSRKINKIINKERFVRIYNNMKNTYDKIIKLNSTHIYDFFSEFDQESLHNGIGFDGEFLKHWIFISSYNTNPSYYLSGSIDRYQDEIEYIKTKFGFNMHECVHVAKAIFSVLNSKKPIRENIIKSIKYYRMFTISDISSKLNENKIYIDASIVKYIIDFFVFEENKTPQNIFTRPESDFSPILRIKEEKYLLYDEYNLCESLYGKMNFVLSDIPDYKAKHSEISGNCLEHRTFSMLRKNLSQENSFLRQGIKIFDPKRKKGQKTITDIDVLLIFGKCAVVFQCKTKRLKESSRLGDESSLKADFNAAMSGAYEQGMKCINAIKNCDEYEFYYDKIEKIRTEAMHNINLFYILCITNENYPSSILQSNSSIINNKKYKIIQIDIISLKIILKHIKTDKFILYLEFREVIYNGQFMFSDEMNIFALFHWLITKGGCENMKDICEKIPSLCDENRINSIIFENLMELNAWSLETIIQ